MTRFNEALLYLFQDEGIKYTDDPNDSGGPTKWGVTQLAYSTYLGKVATPNDIANLTFEVVEKFYESEFWKPLRCEEIENLGIAIAIFDCAVLFGGRLAAIFAQQSLVASGAIIVKLDGIIGSNTLKVLNMVDLSLFLDNLHEFVLQRIDIIVLSDSKNLKFKQGWINRANRLLTLKNFKSIS